MNRKKKKRRKKRSDQKKLQKQTSITVNVELMKLNERGTFTGSVEKSGKDDKKCLRKLCVRANMAALLSDTIIGLIRSGQDIVGDYQKKKISRKFCH